MLHEEAYEQKPTIRARNKMARVAMEVVEQIPDEVLDVARIHVQYEPKKDELVAMIRETDTEVEYGFWIGERDGKKEYERAYIDAVAIAHHTGVVIKTRTRQPYEVTRWKDRIVGPKNSTFPLSKGWKIGEENVTLGNLKISETTRIMKRKKFKKPAAEAAWLKRFGYRIDIHKIWKARAYMLTPRDKITFWKVRHRTLYTRKHDKDTDGACAACSDLENIEHLVDCRIIRIEFWDRILDSLAHFDFPPPSDVRALILLGMKSPTESADPEAVGLITLAWRALYAEITRAHIEKKSPDMDRAYARTCMLMHTRLTAYGERWSLWARRRIRTSLPNIVPLNIQDGYTFIKIDMLGFDYSVHPKFLREAKS